MADKGSGEMENDIEEVEGQGTKFGFVALLGAPNAGKSTLLNKAIGTKVSIISHKVQTTRSRILGIAQHNDAQICFIDTPGIFKPRRRLDRAMVAAAWSGAGDADMVILLVDVGRIAIDDEGEVVLDRDTAAIIEEFKKTEKKVILALNKIDKVQKNVLLQIAEYMSETGVFENIFMISALKGDGVSDLLDFLSEKMPQGRWMYDPEQASDIPLRLLAAEITREKIYEYLHKELPYISTVETEDWEQFNNGSVKISQIIYVERDSQKAIVLGHKGEKIKTIREAARQELKKILDCDVHLFLFVKVRANWGDDPDRYKDWGLDFDA